MAAELGTPFMPWQALVDEVGSELVEADDETVRMLRSRGLAIPKGGLYVPAFREVVVTVMRQSGKTTLMLVIETDCCLRGPNRRAVYTAQTGVDGRRKFVDDQIPILKSSPFDVLVPKKSGYYRAADHTGVHWKNGSQLLVLNTGEDAGHGKTIDLAVVDEAFADTDNRREQALLPAMTTKPEAQVWNMSTAGTPASTYLRRKVDLGRASARAGKREGTAYFEWAVPDDEDVDDPRVWAKYMPAYGITITEAVVRHARDNMPEGEFRRAFCNQWTETEDRIIPAEWWNAVCSANVEADRTVYAVDATQDRASSAVCRADSQGRVQLVAQRPGTGWLVEAFVEKMSDARIVVDRNGPLHPVGQDMERAGLNVDWVDSLTVRAACSRFYDGVADQKMQVRRDERFDKAVAAAVKRSVADLWQWHRDAPGADILTAASLAYNAALDSELVPLF